ncbi:unnamed protein product, partial [Oppiella nova]
SLNEAFSNALTKQLPTREDNIVIVRNYLGLNLRIFLLDSSVKKRSADKSSKAIAKAVQNETLVIKAGEEIPLIATDLKEIELNIGEQPLHLGRVKPLSILELPLDAIYGEDCELKVKPSADYKISDKIIEWRNSVDKRSSAKLCLPLCDSPSKQPLILESVSEIIASNKFFVKVKCDHKEVHFEDTNASNVESVFYQIKLIPIVKLKNLLPYCISYATEGIDQNLPLESGQEADLSSVRLGETGIQLTLNDYLERDWSCFKVIPGYGPESDIHLWKFVTTGHERPLSLDLAVKLSVENSSLIVSLYAPFWMINRTSQQLVYRIDDETVLYHAQTVITPVLLSFKPKSFFCKKKLCLSIGDSRFSDGFSIDVVGSKGNIIAKSKNGKFNYYVSVDIQLSRIGLSKIVTITPFYSIINVSSSALEVSEDNDEWFPIGSLSNNAFWPKRTKHQQIFLSLDSKSSSSQPLSLSDSSSTLVAVNGLYFYVDIDISEWDATIKISDYFDGSAPVMLVNALNTPIMFGQKGVTVWSSKTGEQKHVNTLPANHSVHYTWDLPTGVRQLVWKSNDRVDEQMVDLKCDALLEVDVSQDIHHTKVFVVSFLDGKQRVLLFTNDYLLATNALQAGEITKPKINVEFIMKGIGLSVVNNDINKEILYIAITRRLANRGIWVSIALSEHIVQFHMKVNRLQIDNQMPDHIFGIVMCPVAPPKSVVVDQSPKSFIELSTIIIRQATMNRFKYNSFLIQEFLIQIDGGLLSAIQELTEAAVKKEDNTKLIAKDIRDILAMSTITESLLSSRKSYYDFIHFSPLKVHLSFSMAGAAGGQLPLGLDFFVRSAGVTLTEFNDVVFRLDYFERKNLLLENSELISVVTKHYTTQVLKQFYVLVLGLDLIGNPMKLALGLTEGVGDFFYEPFQGIIQGPGEFAEGISIGVKSLASNVVGGAAGALGSITNTLGEGVSALSMDDKFRRERRSRLNRKIGFAESGKNLFKGVISGVTGVITQPIEGAKEDGIEGLFKGMGKGVVGIIAQPTTGLIDFTSGSLQAVKRAVDAKQEARQMRPPRYVDHDGKLRRYNRHYASGHTILKEMESGKYSTDNYIIHVSLGPNALIMLSDKRLMAVKKGMMSHNWESDWSEDWYNCHKVAISDDGMKLRITTKEQKKKFGIFSGDSDRIITTNSYDTSQINSYALNVH